MKIKHILVVIMMLVLFTGCGGGADNAGTYEPAALDTEATYYADIDIADYGVITIELDQKTAPVTCANFVELSESGFYDGLTFHRIIKGFMIQGGDNGKNDLTPIKGEFSAHGFQNDLKHTKGIISMARTNVKDSATSQFFICDGTAAHLDGQYAAFGKVIEGLETLDSIASVEVKMNAYGEVSQPVSPVIIEKVYIAD